MHDFGKIFSFIAALGAFCASEKILPLDQLKGPWTIRNASQNALPIIGKCASMEIEPSPKESGEDGIIQLKTSIHSTISLTVVSVDHKVYQVYYPHETKSAPLGNVSILHLEKKTFFITEIQTEGQIYFAVFTKGNETSPDTHKKIEKLGKSLKSTKHASLESVENDNCTDIEPEETSTKYTAETTAVDNQSGEVSDASVLMNTSKEPTGGVEEKINVKSSTDKAGTSTIEPRSTSSTKKNKNDFSSNIDVSTSTIQASTLSSTGRSTYSTGRSSDKHESLAIVGSNETKPTKMLRGSGSTIFHSYLLLIVTFSVSFY